MASIIQKRLKTKSHSDEVLKEVKEYFRKYPSPPPKPTVSPELIALQEELAKLEGLMEEEQLHSLKMKSK